MAANSDTLIVKHFPPELSADDQEDLLRHFGATRIRCLAGRGRKQKIAFATFENESAAELAMRRIHQLEILGSRLVVEFANQKDTSNHPSLIEYSELRQSEDVDDVEERKKKQKEKEVLGKRKVTAMMNGLSSKWGIEYPLNPRLHYMYPCPTVGILTNIANALASVPKFYVQVLHLMNKMNLPAPFGPVTATPPIPEDQPRPLLPTSAADDVVMEPDIVGEEEMEVSSTEESELESEGDEERPDGPKQKRRRKASGRKPKKRHKFQRIISVPKLEQNILPQPKDIFEQPQPANFKKIEFKLVSTVAESKDILGEEEVVQKSGFELVEQPPARGPDQPAEVQEQSVVEEGGFGKIEPVKPSGVEDSTADSDEEWGAAEFISSRKLRRGRLSRSEMDEYSVFKKYSAGDPTSRLYIKNLNKQVDEKDLHHIYGRYVNWDDEVEKIMFDIRLMKEGRMKGQAFVTLPNATVAKEALDSTHGFMMRGKPMVVQFARSAKPRDSADGKK